MPSSDAESRLTRAELKIRLDDIFYLDISTGRSYEPLLDALGLLPRAKQDFALHWGKVATSTSLEIGYLVIQLAPAALRAMSATQAANWVIAALDDYDSQGQRAAVARLRGINAFAASGVRRTTRLDAIEARLTRFVHGLCGRNLRIAVGEGAWTDTATLYLPAQIDADDGFERYQALAALLWAQVRFGTFRDGVDSALAAYAAPARAAAWLALLEIARVTPRLMRELPGLSAALEVVLAGLPPALDAARIELAAVSSTVEDSLAWLPRLMDCVPPTDGPFGELRIALALQARSERIAQDKIVLRRAIAAQMAMLGKAGQGDTAAELVVPEGTTEVELRIDGEVVTLPPDGRAAAQSLIQDIGEIPPECMTPAGPGNWTPTTHAGSGQLATLETHADALYDEWDFRRRTYRRQWCHLFRRELPPGDAAYVGEVCARHAGLIRQIRRRFEALRGEDRLQRRQTDGQEIDLDALVAAIADRHGGAEPSTHLFTRRQRNDRSLAAMFMVDMSGSTKGWVNDAEREALVMLCEALEMLGDRYAIFGFSGWTRTRCEVYRIKDFADRYDQTVKNRIAAIEAKDYTRMGPPTRHLTRLLLREPARHRLLVTLSDGRPDDFGDEYRGQYGVEDTRRSLQEARQAGIRAYCVTIDRHGADYLKHMYGPASYTVLDDVKKLPLKIADIYRKLTT